MFGPVCYTIFQMAQYSGSIPRRGTVGAGHAAAPTFIDDTAYRPSSVMAYAMPPSPRGRLISEGPSPFYPVQPYTPSGPFGASSPYTPGAFSLPQQRKNTGGGPPVLVHFLILQRRLFDFCVSSGVF